MAVSAGSSPVIAAVLKLLNKEPNVDVDIVGYDNNIWQEIASPFSPKILPLARVDKQNFAMGKALVDLLINRKKGGHQTQPERNGATGKMTMWPNAIMPM